MTTIAMLFTAIAIYLYLSNFYPRPSTYHSCDAQYPHTADHDILMTVILEIVLLCASTRESYSHQFS